jgi:aminoglycoside phosphotransferase (APT) family kinase protein
MELKPDAAACALREYFPAELGVEVTGTAVLNDGLNLVVAVETTAGRYVVRRPRKLRHVGYFLDIEREHALMAALQETAVPAPDPVHFCDDESVLGRPFVVLDHLAGAVVPLGERLPDRFQTPSARRELAEGLVDTLAEVHTAPVDPFRDACSERTPAEQVALATDRLSAATDVTEHDVPTLRKVGDWLRANAPSGSAATLVHGDFRPGNVLFTGERSPAVSGVLDWETAALGDPLTDLGYFLLRWRDDGDPALPLDGIAARHGDDAVRQLRTPNEQGLAPFTGEPGSPSRGELVARYEDRTGNSFDHDRYYRAKAAYGLAAVWADLDRYRVEAGEAPSMTVHIEFAALLGEAIIDGKFPV